MDSRTPTPQATEPTPLPIGVGPGPDPRHRPTPQGGKVVELGRAFFQTVRHFWPGLNGWIDELPDTRFAPMVEYQPRFLFWCGLLLFSFKLGSRRQLDFELRDLDL